MTAGGLAVVIGVVVFELLLHDLLVILLFFFFLFTVTRAGAVRHGLLLMGGIGDILLTWRRVGRRHERGMEGVRERLIILGIVHDFLEDYMIKAQRWSNALRVEVCNRCREQPPNPVGTLARRPCLPHAVPLRPCFLRGKSQENTGLCCSMLQQPWTPARTASYADMCAM